MRGGAGVPSCQEQQRGPAQGPGNADAGCGKPARARRRAGPKGD